VDVDLLRTDIRSDPNSGLVKDGAPLSLTFHALQVSAGNCSPLQSAEVEIWHCDAAGVYSGVADPDFDTTNQKWLRGSQMTDAAGIAAFTTIYPGWYPGRAVHIHFKVHVVSAVFTSQLFFDEALSDEVFGRPPYVDHGARDTRNDNDGIFNELLLLTTTRSNQGYTATFPIGIDLSNVATHHQGGAPEPGGVPKP
jgi:protocatechuate 3,4-dioxygenase beta subunit